MKVSNLYIICLLFILFLSLSPVVYAISNPLSVPNNKYGIHIIDENDLNNAASLVNSAGGDWGYVTIVITKNDRNIEKWQNIFNRMGKLHLIPIIRLATKLSNDVWEKPLLSEAAVWSDFLNNLKWATKNRYVVIFNEPNHSKEWGGTINPVEYTQILSSYSATLKKRSADFYILPAGFDASAPNGSSTMDEQKYLRLMISAKSDIFNDIDGWTSHSYPNPGFRGKVTDKGRATLENYKWELQILNGFGINNDYPIFITETGWAHQENNLIKNQYYLAEKIADFITLAAERVWNDSRIAAVTPFILNYQSYPFLQFSWQKTNSNEFYPQYYAYQAISKIAGQPELEIAVPEVKGIITEPSITAPVEKHDDVHSSIANLFTKPLIFLAKFLKPLFSLI